MDKVPENRKKEGIFLTERSRMDRVLEKMAQRGLEQLVISDPVSIWYLTGVKVNPIERLFALYLRRDGRHKLFLNRLFTVPHTGLEEVWMSDTDDQMAMVAAAVDPGAVLGVDRDWPARFLLPLMEHCPGMRCVLASDCVDEVRGVKDPAEQEKMAAASALNDRCMAELKAWFHPGMTERDCAAYISGLYKQYGASGNSFNPIVAFGPNAADPHHTSDDTVVQEGDCVLVDTGCVLDGYCSDMTRTYFFRTVSDRHRAIHDLVRTANELAEAAIRPGVPLKELDRIARGHIAAAGYGENFTHRLGHFIGITCHEAGEVSSTSPLVAEEGMCFSIEPGVYLPGEVGVRVEDLVIVTADGCRVLNRLDKHGEVVG